MPDYRHKGFLFPKWLNATSKDGKSRSHGPAVTIWQVFLAGALPMHGVQITGIYDDRTINATKAFQTKHDIDPDGNCGQGTRAVVSHAYGLDLNEIAWTVTQGDTESFGKDGEWQNPWPPMGG